MKSAGMCSPSLLSLYEVLKDDVPPPVEQKSNANAAGQTKKRSFNDAMSATDLELFNQQIFAFDKNEPPKKKAKMETDHDDSDDIKAEQESSMSVETEDNEVKEEEPEITIKIEQEAN